MEEILRTKNLKIGFSQYMSTLELDSFQAVDEINIRVCRKELVCVVGSSGSGKSLLASGILGTLPYNSYMEGEIVYDGKTLDDDLRKKVAGHELVMVPQSLSYLDPTKKVGKQILKGSKDQKKLKKLKDIFRNYGLEEKVLDLYPFELSGGMQRRVLVSTALVEDPKLVIADEPTPGLDLPLAKRVMEHFRELANLGAGVLVITHDLELAVETADRIYVMHDGRIVDEVRAEMFKAYINGESVMSGDPYEDMHEYTKALWEALPRNGFKESDFRWE